VQRLTLNSGCHWLCQCELSSVSSVECTGEASGTLPESSAVTLHQAAIDHSRLPTNANRLCDLLRLPVHILVEQAIPLPETGKYRLEGVFSVESNDQRAVAVFTSRGLAVQYARDLSLARVQVGEFADPIDFGHFLQEQQKAGFTHICVDPFGHLPPLIPIADALTTLPTWAHRIR
jgi:hypothetical protein